MMHLKLKLIFPLALVFICVLCRSHLEFYIKRIINLVNTKDDTNRLKLILPEELSQFRGITKKNLYVTILGTVFDVTTGKNHYGKGSPYHYFTGKDGSRALVTGDFKDESENRDHIMDLSCDDLITITNWRKTFRKKYKRVGVLYGRYFDENGKKTVYYELLIKKIEKCTEDKENVKKKDQEYPPCNIEWTEEQGSKVWCSQNSGGVTRDWVGFPRRYYEPGEDKPRCVCIKDDSNIPAELVKGYNKCPKTSTACILPDS